MNERNEEVELELEVSKDEVKRAVWDCGTDKAPGPDGFTFGFYRRFWKVIENDVFDAVNHFFTYGDIPKGCNSFFIALIPKIPDANVLKEAMIQAPVLALPNFEVEFVVETDASGTKLGVVLQHGGHPISYLSKTLTPKHQSLSTNEKEFMAVMMALDRFTTPFQTKWLPKLTGFNYEISYKKGAENGAGFLQPLSIPNNVWKDISMDFIDDLPSLHGKSVIFVIVDMLSKYAHFVALSHPYTATQVTHAFLDIVYKLHGLLQTIVSDRDRVLLSLF
ncbi:reverse transcriptase [Tanacetum coccineum]